MHSSVSRLAALVVPIMLIAGCASGGEVSSTSAPLASQPSVTASPPADATPSESAAPTPAAQPSSDPVTAAAAELCALMSPLNFSEGLTSEMVTYRELMDLARGPKAKGKQFEDLILAADGLDENMPAVLAMGTYAALQKLANYTYVGGRKLQAEERRRSGNGSYRFPNATDPVLILEQVIELKTGRKSPVSATEADAYISKACGSYSAATAPAASASPQAGEADDPVATAFVTDFEARYTPEAIDQLCKIYRDADDFVRSSTASALVTVMADETGTPRKSEMAAYTEAAGTYLNGTCL